MNRRLTTIAILAAAVAATVATPASASRSCGTEVVQGGRVRITITLGRVACPEARGVIRRWLSRRRYPPPPGEHGVTEHGGRNTGLAGKTWTMPDGWTCLVVTRGGACALRGSGALRFRNPRDEVRYLFA
jgi:hypothetical protein